MRRVFGIILPDGETRNRHSDMFVLFAETDRDFLHQFDKKKYIDKDGLC